uniref:Uncharacterized protein n=1 Tax=viral metagenome TaxID=1070528 RepID=A0A6M3LE21_9ZZZZ
MKPKKLKRSVIKEELVAVTNDFREAIILNQFMYWSERIKDIDDFIEEENKRLSTSGNNPIEPQKGWVYKTTDQLIEELMIDISPKTVRNCISNLTKSGFLHKRRNPTHKWDKTIQYRVDFSNIINAMKSRNYELQGFKKLVNTDTVNFPLREGKIPEAIPEITTVHENTRPSNNNIHNETYAMQQKKDVEASGGIWTNPLI